MNSNTYDADLYAQVSTHTHYDCSRNWVLILVWAEILSEEEGFQFIFKKRQGVT